MTFVPDEALDYTRLRTKIVPGQGLRLDEAYRLAHLPLVAPDHPDAIHERANKPYRSGKRPRALSLVIPIPWGLLGASHAFRDLETTLRNAPFGHKVAWSAVEARRDKLHATVASAFDPDAYPPGWRERLQSHGKFTVEVRGLFSGNVNIGRLYLRVYPSMRDGLNPIHACQAILGRPPTGLYVVGLYNLTDHLTAQEAGSLDRIVADWWDRPLVRFEVSDLHVMWSEDDLLLDGGVVERLPIGVDLS